MPYTNSMLSKIVQNNISNFSCQMIGLYLLLIIPGLIILALLIARQWIIALIKDIRLTRVAHYFLFISMGFIIASGILFAPFQLSLHFVYSVVFLVFSFLCAVLFSIITNNIQDIEIDKISNPNRPTITKAISLDVYSKLPFPLLLLSLIYAASIGWKIMFLIFIFIAVFYIYSMPPYRVKRFFLVSKFLIAINTLVALLIGYEFYTSFSTNLMEPESINAFFIRTPSFIYPAILLTYTLALNIIDLKDYIGDKTAGIKTLSTLFGIKTSKNIVAGIFLLCYLSLFFIVKQRIILLAILLLALIQIAFLLRRKYNEHLVFVPYLLGLVLINVYFLFF